jgi:uncharacterized membrane protein
MTKVEEMLASRKPIANVNRLHREKLVTLEKFAMEITKRVGTMGFFLIVFTWTVGWLSWNIFAPVEFRFDPYPAFVLWLFISNMIQILLMPLLLVGQNLQGKHSEFRAEADYEINLQSEKEIGLILSQLEEQRIILDQLLTKKS